MQSIPHTQTARNSKRVLVLSRSANAAYTSTSQDYLDGLLRQLREAQSERDVCLRRRGRHVDRQRLEQRVDRLRAAIDEIVFAERGAI